MATESWCGRRVYRTRFTCRWRKGRLDNVDYENDPRIYPNRYRAFAFGWYTRCCHGLNHPREANASFTPLDGFLGFLDRVDAAYRDVSGSPGSRLARFCGTFG